MTPQELALAVADVVQDHVRLALAPVQERLAVAEARLAAFTAAEKSLGELRDRVVVVETKSAMPPPSPIHDSGAVDLSPVLERVSAMEALVKAQGDLRDRVLVMETKSAEPHQPDKAVDLAPVEQRLSRLELQYEMKASELSPISSAVSDLTKDIGALRERLAVVEVRPSVPGPQGEPGPPGRDGIDGKDGLAGLSFEGVYQDGQSYEKGQIATWGGSCWHCNTTTTTKPGESKDWTLMVKRGRDGRDGKDAPELAVVKVN